MSSMASWQDNKAAVKASQRQGRVKEALKTVGDVFVPLIPGVIAAGICSGFATLITQAAPNYQEIRWLFLLQQFLSLINTSFMAYITAWAGYRAAEKFGATPILGGMLGMITTLPAIDTISSIIGLYNEAQPLDAILRIGRGGVLAVILGVLLMSKVEKWVRTRMPEALDTVVSPLIILFVCVIPYVLLIMPVTGIFSNILVNVVGFVCMSGNSSVLRNYF